MDQIHLHQTLKIQQHDCLKVLNNERLITILEFSIVAEGIDILNVRLLYSFGQRNNQVPDFPW